jgi:hypothetical protein
MAYERLIMGKEPKAPLSVSTRIPLYWLLAVALGLGVWQGSEKIGRSAYEENTNTRISSLERNISSIQEDVKALHIMMSTTCIDVAVIQNDQKHIVLLLEELKIDIKRLNDVRTKHD